MCKDNAVGGRIWTASERKGIYLSLGLESSGVDFLCVRKLDLLDDSLLGQFDECSTGEGSVDLESVDEDRDRHESVRAYLLEELVILVFVEHDGVVATSN